MTSTIDPERDQIAHLLKLAGRRPVPSRDRIERAHAAARAEWQRARRSRARRWWLVPCAAAMVAVSSATWIWMQRPTPAADRPEIATIQSVTGSVVGPGANGRQVAAISPTRGAIRAGDRVEVTTGSRAAFQMLDGTSVRLAAGTTVVFASSDRVELVTGTLYVDADPARRPRTLSVATPFGIVSHVGTQFELRLQSDSLDVRVREGAVAIESREGRLASSAGEALLVRRDRPAERRQIPTSGPEWAWVSAMAPPFALEGATVSAFLGWVTREQGWHWEYADPTAKRVGDRAVLHGSIDGLTPSDALGVVLPAAGLTSTLNRDRLIVAAGAR